MLWVWTIRRRPLHDALPWLRTSPKSATTVRLVALKLRLRRYRAQCCFRSGTIFNNLVAYSDIVEDFLRSSVVTAPLVWLTVYDEENNESHVVGDLKSGLTPEPPKPI